MSEWFEGAALSLKNQKTKVLLQARHGLALDIINPSCAFETFNREDWAFDRLVLI